MSKIVRSPGEFLSNMLEKHGISVLRLSKDIRISQSAASVIVKGRTKISVSVALRLARYFNTVPEYWLKMQMAWDLAEASRDKKMMDVVKKIPKFEKGREPPKKAAAGKKTDDGKAAAGKRPAGKAAAGKAGAGGKPAAKKGPAEGKPAAARGRKPAAK